VSGPFNCSPLHLACLFRFSFWVFLSSASMLTWRTKSVPSARACRIFFPLHRVIREFGSRAPRLLPPLPTFVSNSSSEERKPFSSIVHSPPPRFPFFLWTSPDLRGFFSTPFLSSPSPVLLKLPTGGTCRCYRSPLVVFFTLAKLA